MCRRVNSKDGQVGVCSNVGRHRFGPAGHRMDVSSPWPVRSRGCVDDVVEVGGVLQTKEVKVGVS